MICERLSVCTNSMIFMRIYMMWRGKFRDTVISMVFDCLGSSSWGISHSHTWSQEPVLCCDSENASWCVCINAHLCDHDVLCFTYIVSCLFCHSLSCMSTNVGLNLLLFCTNNVGIECQLSDRHWLEKYPLSEQSRWVVVGIKCARSDFTREIV